MIAECLLIRDENHLLLEHLAYNAAAGVEHFFIYDNMSRVPVVDFLRENARDFLNICTIERYQGCGSLQLNCYADYLQKWRHEVEWSVFCDTDEIFEGNLKDTIKDFGDKYNCLSFSPILHGCNGHIYKPKGGTMHDLYYDDVLDRAHHWYKVCAKSADIVTQKIHNNIMTNRRMVYLTVDNCPQCVLHHYRFRSFEDYLIKFKRGRANDNKVWQPQIKNFFELNNIQRTRPEVVSLMKKYGVTISTIQVHYERRDTD